MTLNNLYRSEIIKGPNIDPCGTPQVLFLRSELVSPIVTV